jgi:histidinol-phosphatase (PHP family)
MITTSYHNHSTWSDGSSTPEEMVLAAKAAGLREFGLSDHWVIHPNKCKDSVSWSIKLDRLEKYVSECLTWKQRLDDENFTIRIGIEVDFFEENYQQVLAQLRQFPFDYLIGAVHYFGTFPIDHSAGPWQSLSQQQIDDIWRGYWRKIRNLAASQSFDFLAHLDLPKKFNFLPSEGFSAELEETLLALQKFDLPLELNTAGWVKPCSECYPGKATLKRACQLGIPVLVNADAHQKEHVTRFFPEAEQLLKDCGYQQVCSFASRQRKFINL